MWLYNAEKEVEEMATGLEILVRRLAARGGASTVSNVVASAMRFAPVRRWVFDYLERGVQRDLANAANVYVNRPLRAKQDRSRLSWALLRSVRRAMERGHISHAVFKKMVRTFVVAAMLREERRAAYEAFKAAHGGYGPPGFILVSPTRLCNLQCLGCYASSGLSREKLAWDVFDRVITEAKQLWAAGFIVISGGEPFAYRDGGRDLLDMAARHQDAFFMVYTNGTLIDERAAARLAQVGNLSPAISVEGFEERTDARRGQGVFRKVLQAMAHLRQVGVPFGISLTATRLTCEEILSDEFLRFFFEEQGATYGWLFQYMPIGRGFTLDLLPTPEQRLWMWQRTWELINERDYFLADFWNLGTCSDGCISAGREGGYLYIDWNGKVMPCVFFPYTASNINEVYRQGGTLNAVLDEPLLRAVRDWQHRYGYQAATPQEHHNWLMPCPMRDHHRDVRRILEATEPDPEDEAALEALLDPDYRDGLIRYDEAVARLLDPIWEREYLGLGNGHGRGSTT